MNASWVAIDLMEFAVRTEDAVQSPEAALEWLRSFRDTLLMEGRNSRPMPWAVELLGMADVKIAKKSIARMQGQIVKIYGKDCDVDLECSKKYGEKYEKLKNIIAADTTRDGVDESTTGCNNSQVAHTSNTGDESPDARKCAAVKSATACNQLTADGDIREDSQAKPDGSAITRNETRAYDALEPSANIYGDAPRRESGEVVDSRESGAAAPTTVSRNMRRVPQNEAPAHGFSGGRTAQGTMSRSPEAAAQSGKDYDQEAAPTSTDEARQGQARESRLAGGNSLRVAKVSTPPASSAGPAKHQHGEFGNVMLTDDEFAKLCEKCQDADSLITELDQYIESQGKARKYKSHYATLLNWSRRKAQEAKPKQGYMTSDDISKKNYEESKARLEAMFSKGRVTA